MAVLFVNDFQDVDFRLMDSVTIVRCGSIERYWLSSLEEKYDVLDENVVRRRRGRFRFLRDGIGWKMLNLVRSVVFTSTCVYPIPSSDSPRLFILYENGSVDMWFMEFVDYTTENTFDARPISCARPDSSTRVKDIAFTNGKFWILFDSSPTLLPFLVLI